MMVERKLSGVYSTMPIEVAFEHFDSYVDTLMEYLQRAGIQVSRMEVCDNELVQKHFEKAIESILEYVELEDAYSYIDSDTVEHCFSEEMAEARRLEAERQAAEKKRIAEEARLQRELEALTEVQITVDKKHLNKAKAILLAAGLLKKDK